MTYPAGHVEPTDSPVLQPYGRHWLQKSAPPAKRSSSGARIPRVIVEAMKDAGVFGMAMPQAWGGPELDPLTQFRVIEALAMEDGSVGWCAMINCDSGYISAFLDQDVGRAMYSDISVATRRGRDAHGTGDARAWRLSCERTVPIRQRMPAFRVGLAGLCRCRRRNRGCGQ